MRRAGRATLWSIVIVAVSACGPPIQVARVSGPAAYRSITTNALSSDRASEWTRNTINEWGLLDRFDQEPEAALAELRDIVTSGRGGSHEIFALAELSFLHGEDTGKKPYDLAAAVYAYAYLFPTRSQDLPGPLDPHMRIAVDLYNRAVTTAFETRGTVAFASGTYPLPFGEIAVTTDPAQLDWGDRRLVDLTPVAELEVSGMRNRHRLPGLGAALTARAIPRENVDVQKSMLTPRAQVGVTAVLRIRDVHDGIVTGRLRGSLDVYAASETETVTVEGRQLPLEIDETTPIAVQLAGSPIWAQELWGFFGRPMPGVSLPMLASLEPYRPGRIPVVFVHGTQSSPARWADMANDLLADPWIRQRYQFWYFFYDSGNPIPYSGMLLRDKLTAAMARMDPENQDRCLHEMVVIGHSQGGLLTRLTVSDTGDRLWNAAVKVPPDQLHGSEEFRTILQRSLFVKPLSFVRRVVFLATPHRGSFLTGKWVNNLIHRLVRMPIDITTAAAGILTQGTFAGTRLPTAVDNMTPGNPFLEAFAKIPVVEGVSYHSIISVDEDFWRTPSETCREASACPVVEEGNDGVVEYQSAHLDGAASELVVRSPHSCQANPHTIQEVRRILHLHGESLEATGMQCGPAPSSSNH